ncbi:MAG: TetR/AcrR family transcriptional regulator [Spirochaetota bacterium]
MRVKDDKKHIAICEAAIKLIYTNGFADTSMSKIAKEANVSSSTIYVYFDNKEDMLNKVFIYAKGKLYKVLISGIDFHAPTKGIFKAMFYNYYELTLKDPILYSFCEQFVNSPLIKKISQNDLDDITAELNQVIEKGTKEKILIKEKPHLISILFFSPLVVYFKQMVEYNQKVNKADVDRLYELSWRSISRV